MTTYTFPIIILTVAQHCMSVGLHVDTLSQNYVGLKFFDIRPTLKSNNASSESHVPILDQGRSDIGLYSPTVVSTSVKNIGPT